jgi:hypothetical protein
VFPSTWWAALLGHADPSIALRVYAHVINGKLVEAGDIFAQRSRRRKTVAISGTATKKALA